MLATKKDIPHLNYLLSLDEIFLTSVDDTFHLDNRWRIGRLLIDDPTVTVVVPNKYCVMLAVPVGTVTTYMVHVGVDPKGRGKEAIEAAKRAIEWFFKNNPQAHKLIALIPTTNRVSQVYASLVGMRREGMITKSFLKDGVLVDQVMFGLSREDI